MISHQGVVHNCDFVLELLYLVVHNLETPFHVLDHVLDIQVYMSVSSRRQEVFRFAPVPLKKLGYIFSDLYFVAPAGEGNHIKFEKRLLGVSILHVSWIPR